VAEIGHARLEILEHGVLAETNDIALAPVALDDERARLDRIAQDSMPVTAGWLGKPRTRDFPFARRNPPVRQSVGRNRRIARRRRALKPDARNIGDRTKPPRLRGDARLTADVDQFLDCTSR